MVFSEGVWQYSPHTAPEGSLIPSVAVGHKLRYTLDHYSTPRGAHYAMAKEIETRVIDDLEKARNNQRVLATQTIEFSVNDARYSIDLSDDNAAAFMRAVGPFMEAATAVPVRRTGGGRKTGQKAVASTETKASPKPRTDQDRTAAVRLWARQNDHTISDRGRIPTDVINAYEQAGSPTLTDLQMRADEGNYVQDSSLTYAG